MTRRINTIFIALSTPLVYSCNESEPVDPNQSVFTLDISTGFAETTVAPTVAMTACAGSLPRTIEVTQNP